MFGNDANLNGLLESGDSLKVSKVLHKAFIEINEEGSEAAAGSGNGNFVVLASCIRTKLFKSLTDISPTFRPFNTFCSDLSNYLLHLTLKK